MKRITTSILSAALWAATFTLCAGTAHAALQADEQTALKTLFTNTGGWKPADGWGANTDGCTWVGVKCVTDAASNTQHVVEIDIHFKNLTGTTRLDFTALTQLKKLRLDQNLLASPFPKLDSLTELTSLDLFTNSFTGEIPDFATLGLTKLTSIDLRGNQFIGGIPSLGGLTQLQTFKASGNKLDGSIGSLTGAKALETFWANNNALINAIPSLAGLDNLQTFYVDGNQLTGITDLANLPKLVTFNASSNKLSGSIPSLENLPALDSLYLNDNELTGPIPDLTGLNALVNLHLQFNQLSGVLPDSLSGLKKLRFMKIQNNQLVGSPPMPPSSIKGQSGGVTMCPNPLRNSTNAAINAAWDLITGNGKGPWADGCTGSFDVTPRILDGAGNVVTDGSVGSIDPPDTQILAKGSTFSFTLEAKPGYRLVTPVTSTCATYELNGTTFTVTNAVRNCLFSAQFALDLAGDDKDGECGPDHNKPLRTKPTQLCSVGDASEVTGTGPWNWSCAGTGNTGVAAQCTATLEEGAGFIVTATGTGPGNAAPATQEVGSGGLAIIIATPDAGSRLASVSGCGATFAGNTVTTAPVYANCTVNLTFTDGPASAVQAVPTLGEWALMLLAALTGGMGLYLRRRV